MYTRLNSVLTLFSDALVSKRIFFPFHYFIYLIITHHKAAAAMQEKKQQRKPSWLKCVHLSASFSLFQVNKKDKGFVVNTGRFNFGY